MKVVTVESLSILIKHLLKDGDGPRLRTLREHVGSHEGLGPIDYLLILHYALVDHDDLDFLDLFLVLTRSKSSLGSAVEILL